MHRILDLEITKNFLNKIDENALSLLKEWNKDSSINNDEKIAELVGQKITIVRSILNKLSFRGIVKYEKEKDQNSGWYNFYWEIDWKKLATLISQEHIGRKTKLQDKHKMLNDYDFFSCKSGCKEMPFEIAAEYNFACPHCNESLILINKDKYKGKIKSEIKEIETDLNFIKEIYS